MEALRAHNPVCAAPQDERRAHPNAIKGDTMKFQKLTPNLVVRDVAASMEFYQSTLGFQPAITVPDQPPYVFGSVTNGNIEIFFNDHKAVSEDYPPLGARAAGGARRCRCRARPKPSPRRS